MKDKEIVIDELEEAMARYRPAGRPWSERDKAKVRKYYNRVPISLLAKHLERGRDAVRKMAAELGVTGQKAE